MLHESRRIYGRAKKLSMDSLRQAFAQLPYVKIALLFGSRAGENSAVREQSDYDFAVLMDKSQPCSWGHIARLRIELGECLALPDEDFDLVDLDMVTPELMESIEKQYRILKGDSHAVRSLFEEYHQDC